MKKIRKHDARVTGSRFGRWLMTSLLTDNLFFQDLFPKARIDVEGKALRFGRNSLAAQDIRRMRGDGPECLELELADGKILFVVLGGEPSGFLKDMAAIGVARG